MEKFGININRLIIALALGAFFGAICAWATSTAPIPAEWLTTEFLIYIWYNRLILGFIIAYADNLIFIENKYGNAAIRGAILGTILSVILVIIPGLPAISYLWAGTIYGIIIDLVATRFSKSA
ncbi:MAG: hypothetical protein ACFFAN_09775 [Promethearchaeota archaeon]